MTNNYAAVFEVAPDARRAGARRAGGRPRLGDGHSVQIRARVSPDVARALQAAEARTGRARSEIVRDALEEYLAS